MIDTREAFQAEAHKTWLRVDRHEYMSVKPHLEGQGTCGIKEDEFTRTGYGRNVYVGAPDTI
jgi:hypothetical protein